MVALAKLMLPPGLILVNLIFPIVGRFENTATKCHLPQLQLDTGPRSNAIPSPSRLSAVGRKAFVKVKSSSSKLGIATAHGC